MFDLWMGDIELTRLVLAFSIAVLLPGQLLLCFKARRTAIRLLPAIALSALTALLVVAADAAPGWDGLGYLLLAVFTGFMLLVCGIGWGIWAISRLARKKRAAESRLDEPQPGGERD